jgi:2-C-methyl-D-erythritol 4-phosphate cytidylyltransferase
MNSHDAVVIIPAAGQGSRMKAGQNKLFLSLGSKTILEQTLQVFLKHPRIQHIYLVIAQHDRKMLEPLLWGYESCMTIVEGGMERQDSVYNALCEIHKHPVLPSWILIHDGARPFCSSALVDEILDQCVTHCAVIPAIPLTDTIRRVTPGLSEVIDRSQLFSTQTPQGFQTDILWRATQQSRKENWKVTDDASLLEKVGKKIKIVPGEEVNIKITTPTDLKWAQWLLLQQESLIENKGDE